jgi:hypothetical protein
MMMAQKGCAFLGFIARSSNDAGKKEDVDP